MKKRRQIIANLEQPTQEGSAFRIDSEPPYVGCYITILARSQRFPALFGLKYAGTYCEFNELHFMSDFWVSMVRLIVQLWKDDPGPRRFQVLGTDYERREARRSALWVGGIMIVLFLAGALFLRWVRQY